jgi:hypothetical protein
MADWDVIVTAWFHVFEGAEVESHSFWNGVPDTGGGVGSGGVGSGAGGLFWTIV